MKRLFTAVVLMVTAVPAGAQMHRATVSTVPTLGDAGLVALVAAAGLGGAWLLKRGGKK